MRFVQRTPMPRPTNKSDLLALSQKNYESLLALIEQIPLEQQSTPFEYNERDKALRDVLVHLYEWQILLLRFVRTNLERTSDFVPFLPAPYSFKTYPAMNREIWQKHQSTPLENAKAMLGKSHIECMELIETLPQKERSKPHDEWQQCVSKLRFEYRRISLMLPLIAFPPRF